MLSEKNFTSLHSYALRILYGVCCLQCNCCLPSAIALPLYAYSIMKFYKYSSTVTRVQIADCGHGNMRTTNAHE